MGKLAYCLLRKNHGLNIGRYDSDGDAHLTLKIFNCTPQVDQAIVKSLLLRCSGRDVVSNYALLLIRDLFYMKIFSCLVTSV